MTDQTAILERAIASVCRSAPRLLSHTILTRHQTDQQAATLETKMAGIVKQRQLVAAKTARAKLPKMQVGLELATQGSDNAYLLISASYRQTSSAKPNSFTSCMPSSAACSQDVGYLN
jgi:hypothetical protein